MLASTFTTESIVLLFSGTSRENARMSEIIIYDGKEKGEEKFQPDNCHGAEKYLLSARAQMRFTVTTVERVAFNYCGWLRMRV